MKKIIDVKILIMILLFNIIFNLNGSNVSAADESSLLLSGINRTCNIYAKPDGKQVLTYTNPLYQRDVPLLATSGSYYKIMVSGVEGWISKTGSCFNGGGAKVRKVSSIPSFSFSMGNKSLSGLDVSRYQVVNGKMYFALVFGSSSITYNIGYTDVPKGLKNNTVYYSYDGNYFYTNYNTMVANYRNKTRTNAANAKYPYYDYYQYVPMRSKSKISSSALDKRLLQKEAKASNTLKESKKFNTVCSGTAKYFNSNYNGYYSSVYKKGSNFISQQASYQVNSGVLYGIMLNESANGTSNLARHYNNPFGWGAVDSCPNSATRYSSMSTAIVKYFSNMSNGYANPTKATGGNGTQLGNKKAGANVKYASDPHWGYKNAYNYRKSDELASNTDKNTYKIGILSSNKSATDGVLSNERIKVYASASTGSSPYYYERNGSSVIILGTSGSYYRVQKDSGPNSGSVYVPKTNVYVTNTAKTSVKSVNIGIGYQKVGSNHYIWGQNNLGQLGNGKTTNVTQANKINLRTLIPKNEIIKSVTRFSYTNVYVLTNSGNVYSSGSNTHGQRTFQAVSKRFSKTNPFNDKIRSIKISGHRLRMQRRNDVNEYYYVGKNSFNQTTTRYNKTSKNPIKVKFYKSKAVKSNKYSFNSKKQVTRRYYAKYSNTKRTYVQRQDYSNNVKTYKVEWYYVNNSLKSTTKKRAFRNITYYKKGKATKSYRRYYSTKGKLGNSVQIKTRK